MSTPSTEQALRSLVEAASRLMVQYPENKYHQRHNALKSAIWRAEAVLAAKQKPKSVMEAMIENPNVKEYITQLENSDANSTPRLCGGCGTRIYDTWNFCPRCGAGCTHPENMTP